MPQTRFSADAFGVATICLVALLVFLGFFCIFYSLYLRSRINKHGDTELKYFNGPWIIRLTLVLLTIWWGLWEIVRLSLLRQEGRVLNSLNWKWKESVCKCYIVSNLGFAEPGLFLTLVFLLRAPFQTMGTGTLSKKWNGKTVGHLLLCCFPIFILQLIFVLIGPRLAKGENHETVLPHYFTSTSLSSKDYDGVLLCTYPLLNTILLGLFATVLTVYLFWLGRRILNLVINRGLQKRVYTLIFSVSGFLPLRVSLLGLSVLSRPGHLLFEALAFLAFLALLCCAGVCICTLVYLPIADSLSMGKKLDLEARRRARDHGDETLLIANEESSGNSNRRNSDTSTKDESISFRTLERVEAELFPGPSWN